MLELQRVAETDRVIIESQVRGNRARVAEFISFVESLLVW